MIKVENFYVRQPVDKQLTFDYDQKCKKRPSWIKFHEIPHTHQFIKISIDNEAFWYRRYFENYYFPLNNTKEDYENYYDEVAESYESMVPQNKEIAEFIIKKMSEFKVDKKGLILEIGAGTGLVSEKIAQKGYDNLVLVDISQKCLNIAKRKKSFAKCKFIKENILKFNYPKKFKAIYNSMSMDYFNEQELNKLLGIIALHLGKNGIFISVDRHIYKEYEEHFTILDSGSFMLKTKEGEFRYDYFIGKNV